MTTETTAACKYAGADWLAEILKLKKMPPPSAFSRRVAEILGQVVQGIYHVEREVMAADWTRDDIVVLRAETGWLSGIGTYDCDRMTLLVVACHDACIRLEVSAARRPWKLGETAEVFDELGKLLSETSYGALNRHAEAVVSFLDSDDKPFSVRRVRRYVNSIAVGSYEGRPEMARFVREVLAIVDPPDELREARAVFDAVEACGHNGDDVLGEPCLEFVFHPRDPASNSIMLGHPTMEDAVKSARWLLAAGPVAHVMRDAK